MSHERAETLPPGKYGDVEILGDTGPSGDDTPVAESPAARDAAMKGNLCPDTEPGMLVMKKGTAHWGEMDVDQSYGAHGNDNVTRIYGNRNSSGPNAGPRPGIWGGKDIRQYLEAGGDPDLI